MRKGLRLSIALGLVLLSATFLSAGKDKTAQIWVLTIFHPNTPGFVSDSYPERARAVKVASALDDGVDTWVTVNPSRLHAPRKGGLNIFSLFLPVTLRAQEPGSRDALILPQLERDGTFVSPDVSIPVGATEAGVSVQLAEAERTNPNLQLVAYVEQQLADGSWRFRCGVGQNGPPAPGASPNASCEITAGWDRSRPVRGTVKTCLPSPSTAACVSSRTHTLGSTVAFIVP